MKSEIAMVCITAIGIAQLMVYGDGATITACVSAISALAGVEIGREIRKEK